jgi:uncharacterized protein (UPF0210 family)
MTTTTAAATSGKGEGSTGNASPSGTRRFRRFHLRSATVGFDLSDSPVVSFTTFLNNSGRRLFKVAEQLIAGTIRAEQTHGTEIRSARISISPIDKIVRRFTQAQGGASVRDAVLDLCLTLEAVAQRAERHMKESFDHAIRRSQVQQRLYRHEPAEKNFYIGGIGMDLRHGPDPFSEAVMDAIPCVLQQTQHLFAYAALGEGPNQFAWEAVDLVAGKVKVMGNNGAKFAAGINLRPNTPFFPASFHCGGPPVATVGMSGAGFLTSKVTAIPGERNRKGIEAVLASAEKESIQRSALMGLTVASEVDGCHFGGVDPSQAPEFCSARPGSNSVGALLEAIGGIEVGRPGTKDAFGVLMAGLKQGAQDSGVPLVGFGGEFLPVCEDDRLAARASQKLLKLETLMDLTSICAGGLDMCILDRRTREEQIARMIRDVVQSARFKQKPLAIRVIVPDPTAVLDEHGYCVLGGLLGAGPEMEIEPPFAH